MTLRKAGFEDLESICRVHTRSVRCLCSASYSSGQVDSWAGVLKPEIYRSAIEEKICLVSQTDDGEITGLGILDISGCEVSAIYVDPDFAGSRIGSDILAEFERLAVAAGVSRLKVRATLNGEGFYRKHGYSGEVRTFHVLPDEQRLECIEMEKQL